jgi:hypothetical protein
MSALPVRRIVTYCGRQQQQQQNALQQVVVVVVVVVNISESSRKYLINVPAKHGIKPYRALHTYFRKY